MVARVRDGYGRFGILRKITCRRLWSMYFHTMLMKHDGFVSSRREYTVYNTYKCVDVELETGGDKWRRKPLPHAFSSYAFAYIQRVVWRSDRPSYALININANSKRRHCDLSRTSSLAHGCAHSRAPRSLNFHHRRDSLVLAHPTCL